jgi:putative ABC transport system permease protein
MLLIIAPEPRWNPRFLLPLGGMLLGNALAGIVLGLNHYRALVSADRDQIMARLALGMAWFVAVEDERRYAAQAAMLPTISAMLTVGVVSLPGMMTGQIIAGASPLTAVRYQIVVMFMIAAATGIAVLIALHLMCKRERFEDLESGPAT